MRLLAIDSCTRRISVAFGDDGGVLGEMTLGASAHAGPPRHVEQLSPAIQHLSQQCGVALRELDAVAITIGPGMFTGLRVGLTTAKTIASALRIPIVALTSLEVLAQPFDDFDGMVVPVIDARRAEVYYARYVIEGGTRRRVAEYCIDTPAKLAEQLRDELSPILLCGDGALRFREAFSVIAGLTIASDALCSMSMTHFVALAMQRFVDGGGSDPAAVLPLYLRDSDAVANPAFATGRST